MHCGRTGGRRYELHVCAAGTAVGGRAVEKRLLREYPRFCGRKYSSGIYVGSKYSVDKKTIGPQQTLVATVVKSLGTRLSRTIQCPSWGIKILKLGGNNGLAILCWNNIIWHKSG